MKTIGLIGGMSYESTLDYYKIINDEINKQLSGLHSAKMIIESYDFHEIESLQAKEDWQALAQILTKSAQKLEKSGADYIAIATNTMHITADEVQNNISVPLIHIADAAANHIRELNIDTTALLGTRYTMTKPFYKDKLQNEYGIKVIIPDANEQNIINKIIYEELCVGVIKKESEKIISDIIKNCQNQGAKAVILGCTELPLIIKESDIEIINTTHCHCMEIVKRMIN